MSPRILLHGSGAIGTIYLYLLLQAGYDVTAVCRSNYDAVKANCFLIDSEIYGKGIRIHPRVVRSPTEASENGAFDYVIVTTKALPEAKTSKVIAPAVTNGKTMIVLIQNGVGIEDEYRDAFPDNPLLSCVVYLPSTQLSAGHVEMGKFESLEVGTFPSSAYKEKEDVRLAADAFMDILRNAGSRVKFFEDVQEKRWNKLLINAAWNPIAALTLSRDVAFLASNPEAEKEVEAVMLEVVAIAQKLGYTSLSAETASMQLKRAVDRIGGKGIEPSMLMDVLNGRRMEVDSIVGNAVKIARRLSVPVPKLGLIYSLSKALDEAMAYRQPGKSLGGDETRQAREQEKPVL